VKPFRAGDVWGGLSAAALVLPQAMAFGIALWLPYTHDPATAALSGLIAAACLCIASGLFFGTQGLVSSPTGPTLVLLSGSVAILHSMGISGEQLVTATLLTVAMAGAIQLLIGALKLGYLIKFIPYPVVSGFMTGTGILMVMSQSQAVMGGDVALTMQEGAWIPAATAGITLAGMIWLPRWIGKIPGTALGLIAGTLAFHIFSMMQPGSGPTGWVVGNLPHISGIHFGLDLSAIHQLPWLLMLGSAFALAVLASLDTLLTSVVADVSTGARHSARRELMGQGVGHLLASVFGGMAGAGTTGATLVAIESGGRYWAGLVTGASLIVLILFMGPVASILPISVFAGIILHVAIFSMFDKDIALWLKTPQARMDGVIALAVTVVTVSYDLMVAVGLGVALAAIEFIRAQMQSTVVHRRWSLADRKSLRRRPKCACEPLGKNPDAVVGYDLKGTLFFGTADRLFEMMSEDLKRATYIILDMRRVSQVDLTAIRLIEHMSGMMRERGGELILAHIPKSMGLVKREGHRHERIVPYHANIHLRTFVDSDSALEYAEDQLLAALGEEDMHGVPCVELADSELLAEFRKDEIACLEPFFHTVEVPAGDYLFRCGDQGEELFVILCGDVEILLPYSKRRRLRLAKFGPGMAVGEIAFLEPGPRAADARASEDCELVMLKHSALKRLCHKYPDLGMRLLLSLGHDLSQDLRRADAELRRLAS